MTAEHNDRRKPCPLKTMPAENKAFYDSGRQIATRHATGWMFLSVITTESRWKLVQSVKAIQRGHSIGFGHCRIVERGIHEVVQRVLFARLIHNGLTNMNNF